MGKLNVVGVIIKNGFVHFVNSFSFCLIYIETFLEENKGARCRDILSTKEITINKSGDYSTGRKMLKHWESLLQTGGQRSENAPGKSPVNQSCRSK